MENLFGINVDLKEVQEGGSNSSSDLRMSSSFIAPKVAMLGMATGKNLLEEGRDGEWILLYSPDKFFQGEILKSYSELVVLGGDYKPISTQIMSADFDTPIFSIFRHNIGFGMYSNWVNTENAFRFEIDNDNKAITNEKNKNGINLSTTNYLLQNTNLQDKVGYFTEVYNKKFIARMFDDNLLYLYKIDGDEIPTLPISTFDNKQGLSINSNYTRILGVIGNKIYLLYCFFNKENKTGALLRAVTINSDYSLSIDSDHLLYEVSYTNNGNLSTSTGYKIGNKLYFFYSIADNSNKETSVVELNLQNTTTKKIFISNSVNYNIGHIPLVMKQEGQNLVAYILNNRNNDNPLLYFSSNGNYGVSKLFPLNLVDGGTKTYAKSIWELKDLEMLQDMSKNNCVIGNKIYIKGKQVISDNADFNGKIFLTYDYNQEEWRKVKYAYTNLFVMGKRNNFAISFNGIPFYNSMIEHNKIHNRLNYNNKNQVLPELTTSITAQLNYDNVDELGVKMGFGISGGNYTTPTGGDGIGTANVGNYNNGPVYKTPGENTTRVLLLFKNNV